MVKVMKNLNDLLATGTIVSNHEHRKVLKIEKIDLSKFDLIGQVLENLIFVECFLGGDFSLENCTLLNVKFYSCNLNGVNLSGSCLQSVRFERSSMIGANVDGAHFIEFYGQYPNFRDVDFSNAIYELEKIFFFVAELSGCKFREGGHFRERNNFKVPKVCDDKNNCLSCNIVACNIAGMTVAEIDELNKNKYVEETPLQKILALKEKLNS